MTLSCTAADLGGGFDFRTFAADRDRGAQGAQSAHLEGSVTDSFGSSMGDRTG